MATPPPPAIFRAVTSSTRPIHQLLRSISFSTKINVEITAEGIRFTADHARVMQGVASLGKALFTNYTFQQPPGEDGEDAPLPHFQISLPAFLETLQIFGATDMAARQSKAEADPYRSNLRNYRPDAFSNQTLGMPGTCCLSYREEGEPFSITLEESGVKTTCNLVTYVPDSQEEIPFDRDDVSFKIITQAKWILDALAEMSPTSPNRLTILATKEKPYLRLSSTGPLGTSSVDFSKGRELLETFSVRERWAQSFKFDMVKHATEAMRIASKVSLRGDSQGVLSMQFMVETDGGGMQWLHFTFVPYATTDEDEDDEEEDDNDNGENAEEEAEGE